MQDRTAFTIGGLVVLILIFPLGYYLHVSPRFPGSLAGSMIGILAVILMLAAVSYSAVKRLPRLRDKVTKKVRPSTLLTIHIYAGVLGPILGLLHSAHKFDSPIGIALTALLIVVVLSGYAGRFFLARINKAVRGRSGDLAALQEALAQGRGVEAPSSEWTSSGLLLGLNASPNPPGEGDIALGLADVEDAVRAERALQKTLRPWLILHIVASIAFVIVLLMHIWAGIYFGLRWL
jgi:hypothetical protein